MKKLLLIGVLVLALVGAACGGAGSSDEPNGAGGSQADADHDMGSMEGKAMGETAPASQADRKIKVVMLDELAYDPEGLEVSKGEVITFEVTNDGKAVHEFILGDEAYQDAHEKEMADGASHEDMSEIGLSLEPGESGSLTWRFTEAGEVLYACHEPGHYEGGMVGTIAVE